MKSFHKTSARKAQHNAAASSPSLAIPSSQPCPALDLQDLGGTPFADTPLFQRSPGRSPDAGRSFHNPFPVPSPERPRSGHAQGYTFPIEPATDSSHRHSGLQRRSFMSTLNRAWGEASPQRPSTSPPQPRRSNSPSQRYHQPMPNLHPEYMDNIPYICSPTAETLAAFGPPPGNGPGHIRKMKQRIRTWTHEVADVNENQPTRPMPKPLKEWEKLGRKVLLKKKELEEWPGPMVDGERVEKTAMYDEQVSTSFDSQYWGPHPSLKREDGTWIGEVMSPTSPTANTTAEAEAAFPTHNVGADAVDGPADTFNDGSPKLQLSSSTSSDSGQDGQRATANAATNDRLNRAAQLLARQTKTTDPRSLSCNRELSGYEKTRLDTPPGEERDTQSGVIGNRDPNNMTPAASTSNNGAPVGHAQTSAVGTNFISSKGMR